VCVYTSPSSSSQKEKRRAERAAARARADAKRREQKFVGMISSAFDPYMDLYVEQENKQLRAAFDKATANEKWPTESDAASKSTLPSAAELMYQFKNCRARCAKLSSGMPLAEVFALFRRYLLEYAAYLLRVRVCRDTCRRVIACNAQALPAASAAPTVANAEQVRCDCFVSEMCDACARQLRRYCAVVSTAEYCSTLAVRLADSVKRSIRDKYKNDIDIKAVQTEFASVIAKTMKVCVRACMR
jgi:hypothetical protein